MEKRAQEVYTTLVSGFDAEIVFNEDGETADIELFEGGAPAWTVTVDITPFLNDGEDTYTEDLISASAQAAVDLFESERDTLGQGAEVLTIEGNNMRKNSFYEAMSWEDWYMGFKGTIFQDQATGLLESYLDTFAPSSDSNPQAEIDAAYEQLAELEYNMSKIYFERMKSDPGGQTVIVINARKEGCFGADSIEDWLDRFNGHRLEPQALAYAKEYLDLTAKIDNLHNTEDTTWDTRQELRYAMEALKLELMQIRLDQSLPEEGPELAPGMMNDLYELADGVEFDEPLEPMSEDLPMSLYEEPIPEEAFGVMSRKKRILTSRRLGQQAQATPEMWNEAFLYAYNDVSVELLGLTEEVILSNMGKEGEEPSAKDVAFAEAEQVIDSLVSKIADDSERWFRQESPDWGRYLLNFEKNEELIAEIVERGVTDMCEAVKMDYGVTCSGNPRHLTEAAIQRLYYYISQLTSQTRQSRKKKAEADEVTGNEPVEVMELGEEDGTQTAEVPFVDQEPFNVSERIELSKNFEQVLWGGIKKKIPKGTKGKIDDLYDRAGDFYLIRFDDGRLAKVPYEYLKRLKKH